MQPFPHATPFVQCLQHVFPEPSAALVELFGFVAWVLCATVAGTLPTARAAVSFVPVIPVLPVVPVVPVVCAAHLHDGLSVPSLHVIFPAAEQVSVGPPCF